MNIFLPLLAVLFIGLKIAGVIAWSWLWVLAPLWLIPVFLLVVFILALVGFAIKDIR